MLALVEPIMHRCLVDAPYLGCAMLIGACQQAGIETTLIRGQTRWLKNMFVDDSDELWDLIMDLEDADFQHIRIGPYQRHAQQRGKAGFQRELAELYMRTVASTSPRDYFNAHRIEQLGILANTFLTVYRHYLVRRDYTKLRIVERYVDEILACKPSYVGFSLHSHANALSRAVRETLRMSCDVPLIAGGPVTPFLSEQEMRSMFSDDCFDYVVVGEGEIALPRLIESLDRMDAPERVGNVVYPELGVIRHNDHEVVTELDSLPVPDFSQFDLDRYLTPTRILPILTSRGCSWGNCAFCSHYNIYHGRYRALSIERIVESLRFLQDKYDCSHFAIHDEDMPAVRAARIGRLVLESGLNDINFYSYARLTDDYNDSRLLAQLRNAGFCTLVWGVESGNQRVLDLMQKGTRVDTMGEILKKSANQGISNLCFVMFGFPGETEEEARDTVRFLERHADCIEGVSSSVFDLELNSPIGQNPKRWGISINEDGNYEVQRGMSHGSALLFTRKFAKSVDVKIRRISSETLQYVMPGHNRRMLRFLASTHGLMSHQAAIERIGSGRYDRVFPMVLGDMGGSTDGMVLEPVNVRETLFTNTHRPPPPIELDEIARDMIVMADGTRSIETIVHETIGKGTFHMAREDVEERCCELFVMMLSKGYALAFSTSWKPFEYCHEPVTR